MFEKGESCGHPWNLLGTFLEYPWTHKPSLCWDLVGLHHTKGGSNTGMGDSQRGNDDPFRVRTPDIGGSDGQRGASVFCTIRKK